MSIILTGFGKVIVQGGYPLYNSTITVWLPSKPKLGLYSEPAIKLDLTVRYFGAVCIDELSLLPADHEYNFSGKVHKLVFANRTFESSAAMLNMPNRDVAIWFTLTKGSKALLGQSSGKEYCYCHNQFWRRITYSDLGRRKAGRGLHQQIDKKLVQYVQLQPELDIEPTRSALMAAVMERFIG